MYINSHIKVINIDKLSFYGIKFYNPNLFLQPPSQVRYSATLCNALFYNVLTQSKYQANAVKYAPQVRNLFYSQYLIIAALSLAQSIYCFLFLSPTNLFPFLQETPFLEFQIKPKLIPSYSHTIFTII